MTEIFKFFNSAPGDERWHYASDFADYFGKVLSTGLLHKDGSPNLQVKVKAGTLQTYVEPGEALMQGYQYQNTQDLYLTHSLPEPNLDRIDRIVLRLDKRNSSRYIRLFIKEGVSAANPVAPALQRDNYIHEISLAQIRLTKNTATLNPLFLVDERMQESLCGIVYSLISVPTSVFQQQWDSWFNIGKYSFAEELNKWMDDEKASFTLWQEGQKSDFVAWRDGEEALYQSWIQGRKANFDEWFATIRGVLDEEAAGNIMNVINDHKDSPVPHKYYDEGLAQSMLYGLKRNATLDTPAFVYGATEAGPHDVINLPNYAQVEDVKTVIDETAGKVIDNKGNKYLPVMREELKGGRQLSTTNITGRQSLCAITEDFIFMRNQTPPGGYMVHILYNKNTGLSQTVTMGDALYYNSHPSLTGPQLTGYKNSKNMLIQHGNHLLYIATLSGGATSIITIDTSKIVGINANGNAAVRYITSSVPASGGLYKTRQNILWHGKTSMLYYINAELPHNAGTNPVKGMELAVAPKYVGGSALIKTIYGVFDAYEADKNIIVITGLNTSSVGFICRMDLSSGTILSYINEPSIFAEAIGTNVIYEDENKVISSSNEYVFILNKKSPLGVTRLESVSSYPKTMHSMDSESFIVKGYVDQSTTGGVYGNSIRCPREKFYFDGRPSEPLEPLYFDTSDYLPPYASTGFIVPLYGKDSKEVYIQTSEFAISGIGTTGSAINGLFKAEYMKDIKGYEEVIK
ncbi:hypothetical protein ACQKNX_02360 [Lysinibacillus sp. NPDC093712]|uniref:hypothetical protein n=1 Tax=Lysinibacillus sp. NPDC093712 TaxID=3390579 RepID=UPI003D052995